VDEREKAGLALQAAEKKNEAPWLFALKEELTCIEYIDW
jgi:hypothetical protein